jgi:hypothetical protein
LRLRDERRSRSFYQTPRFADDEKPKLQHRNFSPRLKTTVFQQNRPIPDDQSFALRRFDSKQIRADDDQYSECFAEFDRIR